MAGMRIVLLLGGNIGEPQATLEHAEKAIDARIGTVLARSRDHWSPPWGFTDERLFLNRAVVVYSALLPGAILNECLRIEAELGRLRPTDGRMEARPIDIDILAVEEGVIRENGLIVPHPRMEQRRFALGPMADICPSWRHPGSGRTVLELLDNLQA
jgi:2-amino-4-hydroxy-6-hydroxymethyldihydropteridine diphosphokinase